MRPTARAWTFFALAVPLVTALVAGIVWASHHSSAPTARVLSSAPEDDPSIDADRGGRSGASNASGGDANSDVLYWACPMHPDFRQPRPGKHDTPDCGMDLAPVYRREP